MLLTPPPSPKPSLLCSPEDRLGHILGNRIQLTQILGVGAYGTVYKARDVVTNVQYAVKALNKFGLDARQRAFQDREIELHFRASGHDSVVSMQKVLDSPDCTFVVLEYCPEGDLFAKITDEGDYIGNDNKARAVFLQILDAVQHCHTQGIFHRDLKPENILVKDDGWTVKLADFGLATQEIITSDFGCGSTFYMSPECQQLNPKPLACYASEPNDVWSLGVILVNLTCGRNPWKRAAMDDSTFRAYMRDRNFLQTILPISDGLNGILQRIFEVDPNRRISLSALRRLILECPQLGQDSNASLPPSPPYSPVGKPIDSPMVFFGNDPEPVPIFESLPAQQFPQYSTTHFHNSQPTLALTNLPTPPSSTHGSPRQTHYTYQPKPATPVVCGSFASGAGYIPSLSSWSRCSNLVPNFANQVCWKNILVS